jgi:hypothetical protein
MKTLYAACLSRLGLSQAEAAVLHDVRLDTVKSWSAGRNPVPAGAWDDLRDVEAKIIDRSEMTREIWEANGELLQIQPTWQDKAGLMALADFMLTTPTVQA